MACFASVSGHLKTGGFARTILLCCALSKSGPWDCMCKDVEWRCRERAEKRRLQRQLTKERRGAMRELRKDAVFLSNEKERDRAQAAAERSQVGSQPLQAWLCWLPAESVGR